MPNTISKQLSMLAILIASAALAPRFSLAAQLTAKTAQAFDQYVAAKEAHADRDLAAKQNFLYIDALPRDEATDAYSKLNHGQILVQRDEECTAPACTSIPGGLIHDWIGIVFVPGVSLSQALATLQDYNHDAIFYPSEVVKSKLLAQSPNEFHIYLRLKQVHIITVVLDTQYEVHYTSIDADREVALSRSTAIAEVEHAGTHTERDEPSGQPGDKDHGFLWRLNSYWRFYQADGGVYIQCNAVSLTRDVPAGLGWLIGSFIESIPAASLRSTLSETRTALQKQANLAKENTQ
ncbi:MAG TPA: hypothetical protein VKB26_07495 [Candidatus Acidoferrales bacterium]|nr:hypothetical protein [Candidatus Acidoferrales bacterium]